MNSRWLLSLVFIFGMYANSVGQQTPVIANGVILSFEGERVFLDFNHDQVKVGDRLKVLKPDSFFIHPVTGEKITRVDEVIALIEIINVWPDYSEGRVFPSGAITNLEVGMLVSRMEENRQRETQESQKSIAVMPFDVSGTRGGYLGFYIADMLSWELFMNGSFRIIDRQALDIQTDDIASTNMGVIKNKDALAMGKENGIDYLITGTVYETDLIETTTGNRIKRIYSTRGSFTLLSSGFNLASDSSISAQATVNITLRVLNVETGETLFIAKEIQQATGNSQIDLEQLALNGSKLQEGASTFLKTITGQATLSALSNLAGYVEDYFEGKIDVQNFQGNKIENETLSRKRKSDRNAHVINVERSVSWNENSTLEYFATINKGKTNGYKKYAIYSLHVPVYQKSPFTGEIEKNHRSEIVRFRIRKINDTIARGYLDYGIKGLKIDIGSLEEAEVSFYKIRPLVISILPPPSTILLGRDKGYTYFSIGYRINGLLSVNTRIRGFVTGEKMDSSIWFNNQFYDQKNHDFADFLLGFHYRPYRFIEVFTNTGIGVPLEPSNYSLFLVDVGARLYFTNWLSFYICVPVYPKRLILSGFSYHLF
jgi:curli biogenesis system outer membrane secretion channel CsgG